ncbi:transglutaminase-like cysteine peptidase [Ruegeria sp. 2205SS24-7]|uniref:transglutaminase-like cysteine peptidase n=1 Tax=Ruegeria discodermiae TaxID=3064389 RepID=UPI0027411DEA|nr:transglutaminase-like cysteine peptidase [Ruegeria sp. 2205SS24-7]MDP5216141.1 transglutaminase-like cysteine peptidase [Ruegeria sp. 2205SS24-7]
MIYRARRRTGSRNGALLAAGVFCMQMMAGAAQASDGRFMEVSASFPAPSGASDLCRTYSWACAGSRGRQLGSVREFDLVRQVNRQVNAVTRDVTDRQQYNMEEKWALPTRLGGDCEDFALLKKRDLIRLGVDPRKLLLATVLDRRRNAHAVLIYRSAQGDLVLDNLSNQIRPWQATGYIFLRMQDPRRPRSWVGVQNKT